MLFGFGGTFTDLIDAFYKDIYISGFTQGWRNLPFSFILVVYLLSLNIAPNLVPHG